MAEARRLRGLLPMPASAARNRDVLQGMAAAIACEAESALEASELLTAAIGRYRAVQLLTPEEATALADFLEASLAAQAQRE